VVVVGGMVDVVVVVLVVLVAPAAQVHVPPKSKHVVPDGH